jgi:hypothetical protein
MRRIVTKVVFLASLLVATSVATWSVAAGGSKDADRAATMDLMRTVVPPAAYDGMLEQMYAQMSAAMQKQGGTAMPAAQQKALKDVVKEVLPYEDLISWSTDVYLKHFTRKEIDDLAAFYRTPTGKKVAEKLPQITGEVGALIGPMMMNRMPAALKKHGFPI